MVHQSSVLVVLYSLPEAVHRLCDETNSLGIPQYWLSELIALLSLYRIQHFYCFRLWTELKFSDVSDQTSPLCVGSKLRGCWGYAGESQYWAAACQQTGQGGKTRRISDCRSWAGVNEGYMLRLVGSVSDMRAGPSGGSSTSMVTPTAITRNITPVYPRLHR